ncbi:hypothetical protein H0H81_012778 [Sphagnurus paluster]|uniref:Plastocyanin-like domain-containing protein n=1 Tax=Sphagnurus paluster TaxID=117069 RepID=A0A9P7K3J9_9AGAR|nr:hypothetical protein H0H81_012778 [Sphagnurus paluster]
MKYNLLSFLGCLSFILHSTSTVYGADVNYVFNLDNSVVSPDGFSRPGVIINGIYPGTLVQANKDDTLHITVNNKLTNPTMRRSTSIHWHGLV